MKFGIALPNFGKYAEKDIVIKITTTAEKLGFDSLFVSDHIVIPKSHKGFGDMFYEPLTTLAFLAAKTTKILLGTSVIILPYRNPLALAKTISTLDVLSNGRVILGVGAGWLKDEFAALGVSHEERGVLTDEYLQIIKTLWTEENPEFNGKYFQFRDIAFLPKPVQKPHPPVWIGGNSDKALERAAAYGDGWHPVGFTPQEIKLKAGYLNELLEKNGRDRADFTISLRKSLQIITPKDKLEIHDSREPLRSNIEGIVRGIESYKKAGVSHLIFHILSGTFEGVIETMEIFSREIKPSLKLLSKVV